MRKRSKQAEPWSTTKRPEELRSMSTTELDGYISLLRTKLSNLSGPALKSVSKALEVALKFRAMR